MLFYEIGEFADLNRLQSTLESLGFWGAVRNAPALDCFGRPIGGRSYPLVVPRQQDLHADMYYLDGHLYGDQQDQMYLESLNIVQRYSETTVREAVKPLFMENILADRGDIYYQLLVPINIKISKDGDVSVTIFNKEGLPLITEDLPIS